LLYSSHNHQYLHSFPTRRSSDLHVVPRPRDGDHRYVQDRLCRRHRLGEGKGMTAFALTDAYIEINSVDFSEFVRTVTLPFEAERSEEHTSELQSRDNLVCRLLLE